MTDTASPLPFYLLLESTEPLIVALMRDESEEALLAFYGFSDKPYYDHFCAATNRDLRPYPLVKGFLRRRLADPADRVRYIAINAADPFSDRLEVATIESVLQSFERNSKTVATESRDIFRPAVDMPAISI